jgi:hypothetical protein
MYIKANVFMVLPNNPPILSQLWWVMKICSILDGLILQRINELFPGLMNLFPILIIAPISLKLLQIHRLEIKS